MSLKICVIGKWKKNAEKLIEIKNIFLFSVEIFYSI